MSRCCRRRCSMSLVFLSDVCASANQIRFARIQILTCSSEQASERARPSKLRNKCVQSVGASALSLRSVFPAQARAQVRRPHERARRCSASIALLAGHVYVCARVLRALVGTKDSIRRLSPNTTLCGFLLAGWLCCRTRASALHQTPIIEFALTLSACAGALGENISPLCDRFESHAGQLRRPRNSALTHLTD